AILFEQHILEEVLDIIDKPEVFYNPKHQIIYEAILTMRRQGSSIDIATVTEYLTKNGQLQGEQVGYTLTKLTMGVVSSAHTVAHCRVVQEKYILRELIKLSSEIINKSYANEDIFDVLDFVDKKMFEISLVKS